MKNLVILGAGTAGTMMANHLNHELKQPEWKITIIDERTEHHFQPGLAHLRQDNLVRQSAQSQALQLQPLLPISRHNVFNFTL